MTAVPPTNSTARHPGGQRKLVALLDGTLVGHIYQRPGGQIRFVYDEEWRIADKAYPLSLSMPLAAQEHGDSVVNAFLWGLLPDNTRTLEQYGRQFSVSPGNPVALLAHIGVDCAGAVQFATPERVDELLGTPPKHATVEWMTDAEVATALRTVRTQGIPGTSHGLLGQFSLAGAQPKIALLEQDGRWGRPSGRTPTNRILKPPSQELRGFAENEHFCLELATELGLGAARSRVMRFDDEVAIVVERFDRAQHDGRYRRVHQEDICQALGVHPVSKYENEGGPGIARIVGLLRESSRDSVVDVDRFIDATILSWVLAATDAHAKNYALLHGPGGHVRLAPFYDILSFLPYTDRRLYKIKLAMRVGGEYLMRRIAATHWRKLASEIRMDPDAMTERLRVVTDGVLEGVKAVRDRALEEGLAAAVVNQLADAIHARARDCRNLLPS